MPTNLFAVLVEHRGHVVALVCLRASYVRQEALSTRFFLATHSHVESIHIESIQIESLYICVCLHARVYLYLHVRSPMNAPSRLANLTVTPMPRPLLPTTDSVTRYTSQVTDDLFRSADLKTRKAYVALVDDCKDKASKVYLFSTLHVSGEQLKQFSGVAAILRFPLPDLEALDEDSEDDSDDESDAGAKQGNEHDDAMDSMFN
jgi:hypothetical protein